MHREGGLERSSEARGCTKARVGLQWANGWVWTVGGGRTAEQVRECVHRWVILLEGLLLLLALRGLFLLSVQALLARRHRRALREAAESLASTALTTADDQGVRHIAMPHTATVAQFRCERLGPVSVERRLERGLDFYCRFRRGPLHEGCWRPQQRIAGRMARCRSSQEKWPCAWYVPWAALRRQRSATARFTMDWGCLWGCWGLCDPLPMLCALGSRQLRQGRCWPYQVGVRCCLAAIAGQLSFTLRRLRTPNQHVRAAAGSCGRRAAARPRVGRVA